jgi:hypothetical protein
MRIRCLIFLPLILCAVVHSQPASEDASIATLLTGRKNPGDQEAIAALGIGSIDILMNHLAVEQDQNKLPIYARLIGIKYRQFSDGLTPDKQAEILTSLSAKIREIKDEYPSAYLIQSSLNDLQGINHPVVRQLIDVYLRSDVEWTKNAAQSLKDSLTETPTATKSTPIQPPVTAPQESAPSSKSKVTEAKPVTLSTEPKSSTPWSGVAVLIVAAIGLVWLLLKRKRPAGRL